MSDFVEVNSTPSDDKPAEVAVENVPPKRQKEKSSDVLDDGESPIIPIEKMKPGETPKVVSPNSPVNDDLNSSSIKEEDLVKSPIKDDLVVSPTKADVTDIKSPSPKTHVKENSSVKIKTPSLPIFQSLQSPNKRSSRLSRLSFSEKLEVSIEPEEAKMSSPKKGNVIAMEKKVEPEKKKIKLNRRASWSFDNEDEVTQTSKRKVISFAKKDEPMPEKKRIALKRRASSSYDGDGKEFSEIGKSPDKEPPKKKYKPITWP